MTEQVFCVVIGGVRVALRLSDPALAQLIASRYANFLGGGDPADYRFHISTVTLDRPFGDPDADVEVSREGDIWRVTRGDFHAEWDERSRLGHIRQTVNPYSIDNVLRILHTLVLAPRGGFLLHAASVVRNGRAHVFSGVSGAGKTTISRLAPPDVTLLTDEVSYITRSEGGYTAHGTPFAGDLGKPGENVSAPLEAVYLIAHGRENRIEEIGSASAAARALLANILFFAHSSEMVEAVFDSALAFVERMPLQRLAFRPDGRIWTMIASGQCLK